MVTRRIVRDDSVRGPTAENPFRGGDRDRVAERDRGGYEDQTRWEYKDDRGELVFATAFHWIDPAVRLVKSAAALRHGGSLAVVRTNHVAGGTPRFAELATPCYRRWMGADATFDLPDRDAISVDLERDQSPLFMDSARRSYLRDLTYTSRAYVDLLATWSANRALTEPARTGLLTCLEALVDSRFDGSVTMTYLSELQVARRA